MTWQLGLQAGLPVLSKVDRWRRKGDLEALLEMPGDPRGLGGKIGFDEDEAFGLW